MNSPRATMSDDFVLLIRFQASGASCGCWGPLVLQIDDLLTAHLQRELPSVVARQQKSVDAFGAGLKSSLPCGRINLDWLIGRVKVSQRGIVPQNAVSLA